MMYETRFLMAFLDWNGTIVNDIVLSWGSMVKIFEELAPGIEAPRFETFKNEMTLDFMEFYYRHGIPRKYTAEDLNAIREKYFDKELDISFLSTGVMTFMKSCRKKGIKIAIISGESPIILKNKVAKFFGGRVKIDYIIGGVTDKVAVYTDILYHEAILPDEAFSVGDSRGDMISANTVGLVSVALLNEGSYGTEERIKSAKPQLIISSFNEARKVFDL